VNDPESLPALASVVFIRIADYNRRPVAEQSRLRSQLESAIAVSLQGMPAHHRIALDAPDGMAIAVLRNPAAALDIAERCKCLAEIGITLSIGINHGPIQLIPDDAEHPGLIGDAISVAASIADFGGTQRVTMSRAFADALADARPVRARGLKRVGIYTDAQVRTHELFVPDKNAATTRRGVVYALGGAIIASLLGGAIAIRAQQHGTIYTSRQASFRQRLRELMSRPR
jgi:class 3 adenylate cyclase